MLSLADGIIVRPNKKRCYDIFILLPLGVIHPSIFCKLFFYISNFSFETTWSVGMMFYISSTKRSLTKNIAAKDILISYWSIYITISL
jgi:hypothetical protein